MQQMEVEELPPLADIATELELAALCMALAVEQRLNGELAAAVRRVGVECDDARAAVAAAFAERDVPVSAPDDATPEAAAGIGQGRGTAAARARRARQADLHGKEHRMTF